jgi:Asp-tRNA(Asn)/Glu-tRNA(Gln) amidotransferase A subunit family amidase
MTAGFSIEETTIADVHAAYRDGSLTARALVDAYLERIEAYDRAGPALNSIVTVNDSAGALADELDAALECTGELSGPLHGVPVLVKDQAETAGIPTAFGSEAAAGYVPDEDATAIGQLKQAGAIILAKTAMPDWASSWFGYSSRSGETRNSFAHDRDPGGSSSGTGASVSANLGLVGVGEDTGGSIRLPASFNCLVGLKVTPGLISRTGMSPLVVFQDSAGPMARTVTDTALLLDGLVGFDAADEYTATAAIARPPASYAEHLDEGALTSARVGVLRDAFGSDDDPDCATVNAVIEAALESMRAGGAELVELTIPDLMEQIIYTSLYITHSRHDLNAFFASRPQLEISTVEDLLARKKYHPMLDLLEEIGRGPADPREDPEYLEKYVARERFQRQVVNVMAANSIDVICFPSVQVVPPTRAELNSGRWPTLEFPTNTLVAAQTWMPAMSVPAGFTDAGLPIGLELMALPYDEPTLFRIGYAFEQATRHRRAPAL